MPSASHEAIVAARSTRVRHKPPEFVDPALERKKKDAEWFAKKPTFPYCKRLIDDGSKVRGIDLQHELDLAMQNSFFMEVADLPHLYLGHTEQFAQAEATVSQRIRKLGETGQYKIGVTAIPSNRFLTTERHGYYELGYRRMCLVWAGVSNWAAELEMRLIAPRRGVDDRCLNNSPGGENVPSDGRPRFVYIAEAPAGLGNEVRDAMVRECRHECMRRCRQ